MSNKFVIVSQRRGKFLPIGSGSGTVQGELY